MLPFIFESIVIINNWFTSFVETYLEQFEKYKNYIIQPQHILKDHTHFQANRLFEFFTKIL